MIEPGEPLPELHDAMVDADGVSQLLIDLAALAEILEVRVKGHPTAHGVAVQPSLEDARAALQAGASVQIRYAHRGDTWCDTLMPKDGGVRVVRMKMQG